MVHAWAFVRYSRDYLDEEREAAAVRAGVHGRVCEPAWRWRAEQRYYDRLGHDAGSTTATPKWAAKSPSQLVSKGQVLAALSHASE